MRAGGGGVPVGVGGRGGGGGMDTKVCSREVWAFPKRKARGWGRGGGCWGGGGGPPTRGGSPQPPPPQLIFWVGNKKGALGVAVGGGWGPAGGASCFPIFWVQQIQRRWGGHKEKQ